MTLSRRSFFGFLAVAPVGIPAAIAAKAEMVPVLDVGTPYVLKGNISAIGPEAVRCVMPHIAKIMADYRRVPKLDDGNWYSVGKCMEERLAAGVCKLEVIDRIPRHENEKLQPYEMRAREVCKNAGYDPDEWITMTHWDGSTDTSVRWWQFHKIACDNAPVEFRNIVTGEHVTVDYHLNAPEIEPQVIRRWWGEPAVLP